MTRQKIWDIILILFSVYWTAFFLLDYWDKHPNHIIAFQYFKYTNLLAFLGVLGIGISILITKIKTGLVAKFYNGISIYIIGLITVTAITLSYNRYLNLDLQLSNFLHLYGRLSLNFLSGYFIILACYSIGNLVLKRFYATTIKHKHFTYDFGLGAIVVTLILFLLGSLGQLKMIFVLPLLLVMIGINWRGSLDFILRTFIKPFTIREGNSMWGYFSLYALFIFLVLNLFAIDLPFPLGFDSRNFYINIANQIGITNELVSGYQPYSWSLFLSQGFVIFDRAETTLFLSFITGVFCLLISFHLANKYFKISFNNSALLVLLAGLIPTFANHYFVELKTDFALVFYQLLCIVFLMEYFLKDAKNDGVEIFGLKKRKFLILILIGMFVGFGLAIKLLNLFLIYALVVVIWKTKGSLSGSIGLLLIMFSLVLILGLNNLSGLGRYHLGNNTGKWVYFLLGVGLLFYAIVRDKDNFISFSKQILVVGITAAIPLAPWIGKNYLETKSLSPTILLQGDRPGPDVNIFTIERNLNK